jgi:hypothetical protein
MITLFKNAEKDTYFLVDPTTGTANHVTLKEVGVFFRYKEFFDLTVMELPDYKTITQFKKLIAKGALKGVAKTEVASWLLQNYPEYFI